jgi:hypothetical protein
MFPWSKKTVAPVAPAGAQRGFVSPTNREAEVSVLSPVVRGEPIDVHMFCDDMVALQQAKTFKETQAIKQFYKGKSESAYIRMHTALLAHMGKDPATFKQLCHNKIWEQVRELFRRDGVRVE